MAPDCCTKLMRTCPLILLILIILLLLCETVDGAAANPDSKRLGDLLSNYNRLIRPVTNSTDTVLGSGKLGLRLSQLIDVNSKNQIMGTNVWVDLGHHSEWQDHKSSGFWNPSDDEYGGVGSSTELAVPSEHIWDPDIVLYNNADGKYAVGGSMTATKAYLHYGGGVWWSPPAIYGSSCEIDVEYFPFDEQGCYMKFGSWTYDGDQFGRLKHFINQKEQIREFDKKVKVGQKLRENYEQDILWVPERHEDYYCCGEPYIDQNIGMRRKTLFYTVNLIIPCMGISFLTILVECLPGLLKSDGSGEKVALCISILLSLTVFFLLIAFIIPKGHSSVGAVPLLGKYLLFTMVLVKHHLASDLSVVVTILILNDGLHSSAFRKPVTHKMDPWVKGGSRSLLFIKRDKAGGSLPKVLLMVPLRDLNGKAFSKTLIMDEMQSGSSPHSLRRMQGDKVGAGGCNGLHVTTATNRFMSEAGLPVLSDVAARKKYPEIELEKSIDNIHDVMFISSHLHVQRDQDKFNAEDEDWKYVAMVMDRLFLWLFTIALLTSLVGQLSILGEAPSLYDDTKSHHLLDIDVQLSDIANIKQIFNLTEN
uniref:Nicotinic acetylcholine receptor alpha 2 subunit n=2 Tax=Nilaparvata lugens TaxID=108931 RepID=Q6U4B6_NILLU|nr:nicotinic acetylcholine receptor alpha 2 subunit [Nilaparvata lugens]